jgi:hypothetical protein
LSPFLTGDIPILIGWTTVSADSWTGHRKNSSRDGYIMVTDWIPSGYWT